MAGGIAILLLIIVVLVVAAIALAAYGTGSLDRWRDSDTERRRSQRPSERASGGEDSSHFLV